MAANAAKSHRKKKAGVKAQKRKNAEQKKKGVLEQAEAARQNPRAFVFQSAGKAKAQKARTAEKEQRRLHAPMLETQATEPPPFVVLVQGPPQVGKSMLIRCLVKHYARQTLGDINGPVTVVAGKTRRITFVECPQDLHGMLDAAKFADLVLLLVDGSFGFEMETFEFLNLLQVHGFPKVMGVLTHLDSFTDASQLRKTKKKLKARFWTEIYDGAKLFYLSGIQHGKYLKREVLNLARFISVMKSRPLAWRQAHPYLLADRFEDLTPQETVRSAPHSDRDVVLYGWLRGTNMRQGERVHWAGVGDFTLQELDVLPDPCPLPGSQRRRGLNDKERLIYAPMSDVGGLLYDKDAVYIDIPNWKVQYSALNGTAAIVTEGDGIGQPATEGEAMVRQLQGTQVAVDEALAASSIRLFQSGKPIDAAGADSDYDDNDMSQSEDEDGDEMESSDGADDDDDGEDWEESDDEDGGRGAQQRRAPRGHEVVSANGRVRRAALFADDVVAAGGASSEESEGDEEAGGDGDGWLRSAKGAGGKKGLLSDDDGNAAHGVDSDTDSEGLGAAARWKQQLGHMLPLPAAARDLSAYVYGTTAAVSQHQQQESDADAMYGMQQDEDGGQGAADDDDADDEDFFVLRSKKKAIAAPSDLTALDALDTSRALLAEPTAAAELSSLEEEQRARLRSRFVTGDWQAAAERAAARPSAQSDDEGEGDEDEGEDVYGDFEDMETGQRFEGDQVTQAAQRAIAEAQAEELKQAKLAKKAAFDRQYDTKGEGGIGDEEAGDGAGVEGGDKAGGGKKSNSSKPGQPKEQTYYDAVKEEMAAQAARSRAALDALPAHTRAAMEGLRPGMYIRVRLSGVPCEAVQHLDPTRPMLVGGLGQAEDKMGVMKMRFKRHRWFPKLLKTRDPLVFSCGWRRFQALPMYCLEDHNRRLRMLKYSPEHMHCIAAVYGPLAPQNTGVVAIQSANGSAKGWRVSGTAVVLELDAEMRIMKKLKLVGTPQHINRHTAFVQGMFNSQLEASRFEGASVRCVSGVRGTIKKAVRPGGELKLKEGTVRVTFEDKILMSDMVFLRAWVVVDIPRFVNPVTNLLEPAAQTTRAPKPSKKKKGKEAEQQQQLTQVASTGAAGTTAAPAANTQLALSLAVPLLAGQAGAEVVNADGSDFQPAARFSGSRSGFVFKTGPQGLGYYKDLGPAGHVAAAKAAQPQRVPAQGTAAPAGQSAQGSKADAGGWLRMRTVAELRREQGVGAPRNTDSLYRQVERAPRKFNPLHIPKALQAALPFKTKPKLEVARGGKHKTLEQKRAVVMEPHERRAATLLQQLNAIRNDKAVKRREQQARKGAERAKKQAEETAWRGKLNKERRKDRYREEGKAQKRKEMAAAGGPPRKKSRKAAAE